ncbi:MAG TPA: ABC transporter permease [Streptosporangiaceae bacterium]|nr:ABC transporter permease [Streptosporangiaceae bacterium]
MSEAVEHRTDRPTPSPGDAPPGGNRFLRTAGLAFLRQREATVLVVAVALIIYFAVASSNFTGQANLSTWLSQDTAYIAIIAVGEVFLLICGEIDLSVGFIATFAPFLMHYLIDFYGFPGILAIIVSLLMGIAVGWLNGFLTVTVGLPSFITTLGTGFVLLGLVNTTSHAQPAPVPDSVQGIGHWIGSGTWSEIIWAVILVAIGHVVLTRTRWGLHTIAVGGNLLGAQEAGIKVGRIKYGNFMITGLLGAFVGLQVAFQTNTIDPTAGGYQPMFYAVTAAVIGGTAMLGGVGTILGAFLGAIVLGTLTDGFSILGVSANPLDIIFGGAILVAMIANVQLARLREAGRGV